VAAGFVIRPPVADELGRLVEIEADAGRGIGAALIEHLAGVARADGRPALTLTTFRDVPWNAPYYARLGFAELPTAEWGPQLQALVAREQTAIPGDHPRVAMIRRLE
jgi:GNAT superfamily N-acetyltransferase